ncbi:hypothetical protein BN946_scf184866.g2 [Trametes cinnabarina]|uniref:Uncharacterized protein n=1 Tax=Pycnoporus cinnabarinus TaxID=5643 RepID=A0A060SLU9_PYCCI|nr:hypothetical protein BN946_scf184866.g2 [Trametes cinnabarina]
MHHEASTGTHVQLKATQLTETVYTAPAVALQNCAPQTISNQLEPSGIPGYSRDLGIDLNGIGDVDFDFTPEQQQAYFPAHVDDTERLEEAQEQLRGEFERLSFQALEEDLDGTLPADEADGEDLDEYLSGIPRDRQYPPYGSKTDLSHPELARNLMIYPDESQRPYTDFSQSGYMKTLPCEARTPAYYVHNKHFFVDELSRTIDNHLFIPRVWVTRNGKVHAHGHIASPDMQNRFLRISRNDTLVLGERLTDNLLDLLAAYPRLPQLIDDAGELSEALPHPDREIAQGEDLIVICTPLFCDDVSGARSKQYQKHINIYTTNWNLPSRFIQQESAVRFISTSPTAGGCEQFTPVLDLVKCTRTGVKDKIATFWIDKLLVRSRLLKRSHPNMPRDDLIADGLSWLREQTALPMNPLLDVPDLDPHRDTPVELLHTWLLGIVKYVWHTLHTSWTEAQRASFVVRLQDTDTDGLNIPPLRAAYIMQYRHGLIGKHFKSLAQTMAAKTHGLTTADEATLDDLHVLIGNVLDAFANIDPARIIVKEKLQVLPHIVEDIRRFGPPPRYSTETYECFNAVFRLSSVHSNHGSPSHDIAVKMADIECVRHIVTGGFWEDSHGHWTCAGSNVLATFRNSPLLQHHFGWTLDTPLPRFGHIASPPIAKQIVRRTEDSLAATASSRLPDFPPDTTVMWCIGASVIAHSGDVCRPRSWVVVTDNKGIPIVGRIEELLLPVANSGLSDPQYVVIERFLVGSMRHSILGFPVLRPPEADKKLLEVVSSKFIINVQHDCEGGACQLAASQAIRQERKDTGRFESAIDHNPSHRYFFINTHALHNAALLRRFLPRSLLEPLPLYDNRRQRHDELAAKLRITEAQKRAQTQRKRVETLQKKAQHKNNNIVCGGEMPSTSNPQDSAQVGSDSGMTDAGLPECPIPSLVGDGEGPSTLRHIGPEPVEIDLVAAMSADDSTAGSHAGYRRMTEALEPARGEMVQEGLEDVRGGVVPGTSSCAKRRRVI